MTSAEYQHPCPDLDDRPADSPEAPYAARSGQRVEIYGPLDPADYDREDVGPMYRIGFDDGFIGHAFASELVDVDGKLA